MAAESFAPRSGGVLELACLEAGGRLYGVEVMQMREIVRSQEVTPLPRAPLLIEGVIDLRGAVVPVIDLGRALHGEPVPEGSSTRIAVLEVDGMVLGLRVEAAVDIASLDAGTLKETPALASHAGYDAVRAIARRPDAPPVLVLSLEHLLEAVYRSALPASGETP